MQGFFQFKSHGGTNITFILLWSISSCSRTGVVPRNIVAAVPKNMPFVLFFSSDTSQSGDGFSLNANFY